MKNLVKAVLLSAVLISTNVFAKGEVGAGYSHINQDFHFEKSIKFDMPTVMLSYTHYLKDYEGLGLELTASRSMETDNSVVLDTKYTNRIDFAYSVSVVYKHHFNYLLSNDWYVKSGVGLTEYRSTWTQDGVEPSWSKGWDSYKPSLVLGVGYNISEDFSIDINHRWMYHKVKEGYGVETTNSWNISLVYRL
jgi:hypothetical protein